LKVAIAKVKDSTFYPEYPCHMWKDIVIDLLDVRLKLSVVNYLNDVLIIPAGQN